MKKTLLTLALAAAASSAAGQSYGIATVTHVEPVQHRGVVSVPRQVCGVQSTPIYNTAPVYGTYKDPNSPAPIVGMIVGAVVGYHAMGNAPGLGAMLGGTVGYSVGDRVRSSHPYWTGQTVSTVTYHNQTYCTVQNETMEVMRTIGYRVTYVYDGISNTVVMTNHPGSHIRVSPRMIQ